MLYRKYISCKFEEAIKQDFLNVIHNKKIYRWKMKLSTLNRLYRVDLSL